MKKKLEKNVKKLKVVSISLFAILMIFNITFSENVFGQSNPGTGGDELTCYQHYGICDWGDECDMVKVCPNGGACPTILKKVDNGLDPVECS